MTAKADSYIRDNTKRGDQLAQAVATTSAVSILSPAVNIEFEITEIVITNTSNQNRWLSLFHDKDGTTYTDATALIHEETINSSSPPEEFPREHIFMRGAGNIAIQAQANTVITVTIYGFERQL
jgi:hypothetical protein